tara:strand:+ start:160 stop:1152 length:993 start_codon:yes stop_codon:yes gene_type:complete
MENYNYFTSEERQYLLDNRPDLAPMIVPSLEDIEILSTPSLDQIIIHFLEQYEVFIEPRSVGAWNGWDTLSTINIITSDGSLKNIASTIFFANRSNQIKGSAKEWNTWKRWALDHKDFKQFKNEVIQNIEIHNKSVKSKLEKEIQKAELNNKRIKNILQKPEAKEYFKQLIEIERLNQIKRGRQLLGIVIGVVLLVIMGVNSQNKIFESEPQNIKSNDKTKLRALYLYNIGRNYEAINNAGREAFDKYDKAFSLDPNNPKIINAYIRILKKRKENDLSILDCNIYKVKKAFLSLKEKDDDLLKTYLELTESEGKEAINNLFTISYFENCP